MKNIITFSTSHSVWIGFIHFLKKLSDACITTNADSAIKAKLNNSDDR